MIVPLVDNIVAKQLGGLTADAEALLSVAAWPDLPAGLRIIDCDGSLLSGFCSGSGHSLAQAHGFRPGTVAVAVAAEAALRVALEWWPDDPDAVVGEAGVMIEAVGVHEAAHALVADIDGELRPGEGDLLRRLPAAVGSLLKADSAERTARDHGAAWAAALVILAHRCQRYRPGARHRWGELLDRDLRAHGLDVQAVADAVGDVADELPLRALLVPGGDLVGRVAEAIPCNEDRAALIAAQSNETASADPGHVAPVAAGVAEDR
jgi:hypothetical protein